MTKCSSPLRPDAARLSGGKAAPGTGPVDPDFPIYRHDELAADRAVHVAGLLIASTALGWLLMRILPHAALNSRFAVIAYAFGVMSMLGASAAYNLVHASRLKSALRVVDHAMIFVMIASSYTPYALVALQPRLGVPLCIGVWLLAAIGVALKLFWFDRLGRLSLLLYLGMGWLLLAFIRPLIAALQTDVLLLLLAGGVVYTAGTAFHLWERLRFHNAIWHAMVLTAVLLHLAGITLLLRPDTAS